MTSQFVEEVVRSLGKEHAYALVAEEVTCAALLTTLIPNPKLASFLVLRQPSSMRRRSKLVTLAKLGADPKRVHDALSMSAATASD